MALYFVVVASESVGGGGEIGAFGMCLHKHFNASGIYSIAQINVVLKFLRFVNYSPETPEERF